MNDADRPTGDAVVRCDRLTVDFGDRRAVDSLTLTIRRGERIVLLGATGSGKSTILNVLVGALKRTSGEVEVVGLDPQAKWFELRGRIAIAFQEPRLVPWRTALQNVDLGLKILGQKRRPRRQVALDWLERVKLGDAVGLFPSQMSGGMQQRVSLARALAIHPDVIFLDEAFSKLDAVTAGTLRRDFRDLIQTAGITSVIVTHDINEALFLGTRIVVLSRPANVLADLDVPDQLSESERAAMRAHVLEVLRSDAKVALTHVDGGDVDDRPPEYQQPAAG